MKDAYLFGRIFKTPAVVSSPGLPSYNCLADRRVSELPSERNFVVYLSLEKFRYLFPVPAQVEQAPYTRVDFAVTDGDEPISSLHMHTGFSDFPCSYYLVSILELAHVTRLRKTLGDYRIPQGTRCHRP